MTDHAEDLYAAYEALTRVELTLDDGDEAEALERVILELERVMTDKFGLTS